MAIGRFAVSCFLSFVVQASNDFFFILELTYWRAFVFRGQAGRPPIVELREASGKRAFTMVKLGRAKIPLL